MTTAQESMRRLDRFLYWASRIVPLIGFLLLAYALANNK